MSQNNNSDKLYAPPGNPSWKMMFYIDTRSRLFLRYKVNLRVHKKLVWCSNQYCLGQTRSSLYYNPIKWRNVFPDRQTTKFIKLLWSLAKGIQYVNKIINAEKWMEYTCLIKLLSNPWALKILEIQIIMRVEAWP